MYKKHFEVKNKPFNPTPDPDYLYLSSSYNKALEHFSSLVSGKNRLVVFTGAIGSGKTVLLRSFVKAVPSDIEVIQFNYAGNDRIQFLHVVLHALGVEGIDLAAADVDGLRNGLKSSLNDKARGNGSLIFVIDEAQNLEEFALDEVWRMLEIEINERHPVRILLAGLPKLQERVALLKKVDPADNEIVSYHLELLPEDEVAAYIGYRLSVAGAKNTSVFSEEAVKEVARVSGGTPRLINIICDSALLNAYFVEEKFVTPAILKEVFQDLFYKSKLMGEDFNSSSENSLPPRSDKAGKNAKGSTAQQALSQIDGGIVAKVYDREAITAPKIEKDFPEDQDLFSETNNEESGVQLLDRVINFADSLTGLGVSRDDAMGAFRDYVGADKPVEIAIEAEPGSKSLPLSILLFENNARMRIHLENKLHEVGFNPQVLTGMDELFNALNSAETLEIQVLVADTGYFLKDARGNDFEGQNKLKRIRADYAHVPLLLTSALPITSVRANFMQAGIPFLLHKPDLSHMDISRVQREFSKFFQDLYGSLIGIHSMFNAFYRRISGV